MKHLLVRISTIGMSLNAPICNIGVISFDPTNTRDKPNRCAISCLDWKSQIKTEKFDYSKQDFDYWRSASKADRSSNLKGTTDLGEALNGLTRTIENMTVWTPQANFHQLILLNAYKTLSIRPPWELLTAIDALSIKSIVELTYAPRRTLRDYAKNMKGAHPGELLIDTARAIQHLYAIQNKAARVLEHMKRG